MGDSDKSKALRSIPAVDRLLAAQEIEPLLGRFSEEVVKKAVRKCIDGLRESILAGKASEHDCSRNLWLRVCLSILKSELGPDSRHSSMPQESSFIPISVDHPYPIEWWRESLK